MPAPSQATAVDSPEGSRLFTQATTQVQQAPTQEGTTQLATSLPNVPKGKQKKKRVESINAELDLLISRLMNFTAGPDGKIDALNDVSQLHTLCLRVRERFMNEKALLRIGPNIFILGDIHGQFKDLQKVFSTVGAPPKRRFLFLGDYVDRGANSLETITLLLALKLRFPRRFYLLRGNHEARATNAVYGFIAECRNRFGKEEGSRLWTDFQHVFNVMPFAALVGGRIFCAHGGISQELVDWKQFDRVVRPTDVTDFSLLTDLLWSDPCPSIDYYADSPRNVSQVFGSKAVDDFCARMGVDMIVRGHQAEDTGYATCFNNRCITIFSAPHYTTMKNRGGIMFVSKKMQCSIYNFSKTEAPEQ